MTRGERLERIRALHAVKDLYPNKPNIAVMVKEAKTLGEMRRIMVNAREGYYDAKRS